MTASPFYLRFLVALAAAQPLRAGAQEIHGVVANELTGTGLAGAEVRARSLDGTVLATVGTDAVGRFVLRLPVGGRILLSARREGYVPIENVSGRGLVPHPARYRPQPRARDASRGTAPRLPELLVRGRRRSRPRSGRPPRAVRRQRQPQPGFAPRDP